MKYYFSLSFLFGLLVGNIVFMNYSELATRSIIQLSFAGILLLIAFKIWQLLPYLTMENDKPHRRAVL